MLAASPHQVPRTIQSSPTGSHQILQIVDQSSLCKSEFEIRRGTIYSIYNRNFKHCDMGQAYLTYLG